MSSFSATLDGWVSETPERINAVRKQAFQGVLSIAQVPVGAGGNMPVKDGFLRASLLVSIGPDLPQKTSKPKEGVPYSYNPSPVNLTIAGVLPQGVLTAAWTAEYARLAEYGNAKRPARRFRDLAAQQWPRLVAEAAAEANRIGASNGNS